MKFRYLGKEKSMIAFGHDFSDGQVVDVTNENAIKRLSGNSFFEAVEDEGDEAAKKEAADKAAAEAAEKEAADKAAAEAAEKEAADKAAADKTAAEADKNFPKLPGTKK